MRFPLRASRGLSHTRTWSPWHMRYYHWTSTNNQHAAQWDDVVNSAISAIIFTTISAAYALLSPGVDKKNQHAVHWDGLLNLAISTVIFTSISIAYALLSPGVETKNQHAVHWDGVLNLAIFTNIFTSISIAYALLSKDVGKESIWYPLRYLRGLSHFRSHLCKYLRSICASTIRRHQRTDVVSAEIFAWT
jgi:hypothetical protein